ncbi:ATP-dependent RecD-like DNA helicase [uncultured archaeon]|nr:ATP-dependent RecD-like DNA helicase [uncultured archaeon]
MSQQVDLKSQNVDGSHIDLNEDFKTAFNLMEKTADSVFITGRAGTGKSTLLSYFRGKTRKNVAVLAPTGVAALNIKGQTIHSFFKFKPGVTLDSVTKLYGWRRENYEKLDAIIIDEISMVRADLLDCVDRFMRLNGPDGSSPFGGVQMIFVGDLYQLPPVVTQGETAMFKARYRSEYFFDSRAFEDLTLRFVELKKNYRQADERFITMLNAIRTNTATDEDLALLNSRVDPQFVPRPSEGYVSLTPTNRLADEVNKERMAGLRGELRVYHSRLDGDFEKSALPADEALSIKQGMQVMLLTNDKLGRWANGSIGSVMGIATAEDGQDAIAVELTDGSQVEITPYTWELYKFSYDPKLAKLEPKTAGSFTQYPLMPAWAITIHKSQGKTFGRVVIDIGSGTFAYGQLYVALSRCTSLEGIVLRRRIERRHILMDDRVAEFLRAHKL